MLNLAEMDGLGKGSLRETAELDGGGSEWYHYVELSISRRKRA
jgi:hypothetical protein